MKKILSEGQVIREVPPKVMEQGMVKIIHIQRPS
jgi:hypothetical protein